MGDLLLSFIANGAGVVEHETSFLYRLHLAISLLYEGANHLFGVVNIHLAAKGLQVESLLARGLNVALYSHYCKYIAGFSPWTEQRNSGATRGRSCRRFCRWE